MAGDRVEHNKAVVRRYFEEYHSGRRDAVLDEICAEGLRAFTRRMTAAVRTAFPDYRIAITAQVAEGDVVATVWELRGTHEGEWASPIGPIAPTGKPVAFTATTTLRLEDGRLAEVVGTNWDHLGILQQLGALPLSVPRPGA